ncbi:hypothetical protein N826_22760 [Skermanella aerolata KACC 11604]|nr:hypothetical protein N826_22760 [Skermanella aerolata KACC 11604]
MIWRESGLFFAVLVVSRLEQGVDFTHFRDPLTSIRILGKQIFDKTPLVFVQFSIHVGKQQKISDLVV